MKFPGIRPAGSGDERGWQLAGSDPGTAKAILEQLDAQDPTVEHAVQVAEVMRRVGRPDKAVDRARTAHLRATSDAEHALLHLVEGTAHWSDGQASSAKKAYAVAARLVRDSEPEWTTAAMLGLARAGRINLDKQAFATADEALSRARSGGDRDLLADALRERAAWALMRGDHSSARRWAVEAVDIHDETGDDHLAGHARVVLARAVNAAGDTECAADIMRDQVNLGRRTGAVDLTMTASTFLGQFLQHGASPDSARWTEGRDVLLEALADVRDPFTEAELLLPLAHLWTTSGHWPEAHQALDEYERLYAAIGGNAVADANAAKARARLRLAERNELPLGGFRPAQLTPVYAAALLALRRTERLYRRARLAPGARRAREQRDLLYAVAGARWSSQHTTVDASATPRQSALARAWQEVLTAMRLEQRGRTSDAADAFARARTSAEAGDSSILAVVSGARCAEAAIAAGRPDLARAAIRDAVRSSETIRGAVDDGHARGRIAGSMRRNYERTALQAAALDDGELLLQLLEALRAERLADLIRGRALPTTNPRLDAILGQLGELDEQLALRENFGGLLRNASSTNSTDDPALLPARRAAVLAALAAETGVVFSRIQDRNQMPWPDVVACIDQDVLAVVHLELDDEPPVLLSAWRSRTGETATATVPVTDEIQGLRAVLIDAEQGRRPVITSRDIGCLAPLLPRAMVERLRVATEPVDLLVVPSGWTWAVPFCALPVADRTLLVDHCTTTLAASLRTHALLASRPARVSGDAALSYGPGSPIHSSERDELAALAAFTGGHRTELDAASFRGLVTTAGDQFALAAVAAHGNRAPGLSQAVLDAEGSVVVTAADFLRPDARAPEVISFGVCHGMYPPNDDQYEPLGLAICALSAGARCVVASHFELDDPDGQTAGLLRRLYEAIAKGSSPAAALAALQRDPHLRRTPLARWAVLAVLGPAGGTEHSA